MKNNIKVLKLKKQSGVSLIALVVTVIVLLILTGVSFSSLTGEHGVLNQAKDAKIESKEKENLVKEKHQIIDNALKDL